MKLILTSIFNDCFFLLVFPLIPTPLLFSTFLPLAPCFFFSLFILPFTLPTGTRMSPLANTVSCYLFLFHHPCSFLSTFSIRLRFSPQSRSGNYCSSHFPPSHSSPTLPSFNLQCIILLLLSSSVQRTPPFSILKNELL